MQVLINLFYNLTPLEILWIPLNYLRRHFWSNDMTKVGIIGYGITPFTKEDKKIENVLLDSTKEVFKNNQKINRG